MSLPRPPNENILAHGMWPHIVWVGLLMGGVTLLPQAWAYHSGSAHWQSMVFTVLTLSQLGHVLAVRSERESLFAIEWLSEAPHAPVFKVRDTVNKYGHYAEAVKIITIKDLIKFHGHFCGGLVEAATTLKVAFETLFPDGLIDRTDLVVASNNSACGGDVAAYLTGARARFGSHLIDPSLRDRDNDYKSVPEAK